MRARVVSILGCVLFAFSLGAWGQSFTPFVVKDIRVEGLQRTEAGPDWHCVGLLVVT